MTLFVPIRAAEEIAKAGLAGSPMNGHPLASGASERNVPAEIPSNNVHVLGNVVNMPRPAWEFQSIMGPGVPLGIQPIDELDPTTGRPLLRAYEYQVARNLNISQTEVPWGVLTSLYTQCDIVWRACEIRITEITKMDHSFSLTDAAIAKIMADQKCSHAKAAQIGRDLYADDIARADEFWDNPYPQAYRDFTEWMTEALWNHFPFDAICAYPRFNLGGQVMGIELIDPRTIKPLLDSRGFVPTPPFPAYQQILWGYPRGETVATEEDVDPETGKPRYLTDGVVGNTAPTDQLIYVVKNRRTISPYGFSMVEAMIPAATVYLERQNWLLKQFQAGASAQTWIKTDSLFSPSQSTEWNRVINNALMGNSQTRQQVQTLPAGFDPVFAPEMAEKFKADMDEYFIKRVAAVAGINPSSLGVTPRSGLGGRGEAEEASDQAELISQKPMEQFVEALINRVNRQILGISRDISFVLHDDKTGKDDLTTAQGNTASIWGGWTTINEVRGAQGLPISSAPEADELMIIGTNGVPTFLKDLLSVTQAKNDAALGGQGVDESDLHQMEAGEQGQTPLNGGSQTSSGQSDGKAASAALEQTKFATYAKKRRSSGTWRDFEFEHVDAELAKMLNESGRLLAVGSPSGSPKD